MRPKKPISRLTEFRNSLNLSVSELASKYGIGIDYWYYYERGNTETHLQSFLRMKELASRSGIKLNEYLFCKEQKNEYPKETKKEVSSLKELREILGLSKEEIAKACGVRFYY